jgi:hypothetical protein
MSMNVILCAAAVLAAVAGLAAPSGAGSLDGVVYRVTLETGGLGPVEAHLAFEERDGTVEARSLSGALESIRQLPGARDEGVDVSQGLFAWTAARDGEGYAGTLSAPWAEGKVAFAVAGDTLEGSIQGGLFAGSFRGVRVAGAEPVRNYPAVLAAFDEVVRAKVFEPDDLDAEAYRLFRRRLGEVASTANDDLDFLLAFRFAWTNNPFSHFDLRRSPVSAEAMMKHFDEFRVGKPAARLALDGDLAILRVDTMMGNDTIEHVEAAYDEIAKAGAQALIIDLRGNEGGAFAVKPLVEHVIDEPMDAGYFMSQKWNGSHGRLPSADELAALVPWTGWSVSAFWRSVQDQGLLRIRMQPAQPHFAGPVFVVVDHRSASATELAADALRASGRARLVGERTVGHMLSQSPFDVAEGFVISLPVADYCSATHGRLEGVGVPVDVEVPSESALEQAKSLAREALLNP